MSKTNEISAADVLASLISGAAGAAGKVISGDEVAFHDGPKIILPNGMTYPSAYAILKRLEEEAEMVTSFDRTFRYRSDDGAYATIQVIKERYGMLLGKQTQTFFGVLPAETRTISIGVGQTMQVPWGRIEIPIFPGLELVLCDQHHDKDYGKIFEIHAAGPRKYRDDIEEFFDAVEDFLRTKSIYRGRAIIGSDEPEFLDLSAFRADQVVFSDEATRILEGTIHAPIRYTDALRREGISLKRAVLLEGPFGTGKTSEGQIVAQIATDNGWTFISARPGRDKVEDVLRTARLYQPAVVFVEDIDGAASSGEDDDVTKMLDAFDGITAKGGELMVVMTTNHVERIHKGMLRPGRLDAVIHIGSLDASGIERLIKAVVKPGKLSENVNYVEVSESMTGFYPAFVKEAITRAVTISIGRNAGSVEYVIDTVDLVTAAQSLHAQLAQLEEAGEGVKKPALDAAFGAVMSSAMQSLAVDGRAIGANPMPMIPIAE
jgi:transitional endoplasmic reticulum ATPase